MFLVQSAANYLNSDLRVSEHLSLCLLNDGRGRLTLPSGEIPQLLNADPAILYTEAQCNDPTLDRNNIEFYDEDDVEEYNVPIEDVEDDLEKIEKPKKNKQSIIVGDIWVLFLSTFVIRFRL